MKQQNPKEFQENLNPELVSLQDLQKFLLTTPRIHNQKKDISTQKLSNFSFVQRPQIFSKPIMDYQISSLICGNELNFIQTPIPKRMCFTQKIMEEDTHINKQPISIQSKVNFNEEEEQLSSNLSKNNDENDLECQQNNSYSEQQINSKEFQEQQWNDLNNGPRNQFKSPKEKVFVQEPNRKDQIKRNPCNCKKTQCLKLYCDCFRQGNVCGQTCSCIGCHNTTFYESQRQTIMQQLNKRNPQAFKQKIQQQQHSKGCNCKRTFCQKKYCQCYQAGVQCGINCKCQQCKNNSLNKTNFNQKQQRYKQTIKKERVMRQYVY